MRNNIVGLIFTCGFIAIYNPDATEASEVAPCPPKLFGGDADSNEATCGVQPDPDTTGDSGGNDDEFGVADSGVTTALPGQPTSCDATFNSDAEFITAYDKASCGDAICASGSFAWNTARTLTKECTAANPLWIMGYNPATQSIQAITFNNAGVKLAISGDYNYIAGFKFKNPSNKTIEFIGSKGGKALGNWLEGGTYGPGSIQISGHGANDDIEIAYNTVKNAVGMAIQTDRCDQSKSSCTNFPKRTWIHHNDFLDSLPSGENRDGIKFGLDWLYIDSVRTYNSDGLVDGLIENNLFSNYNVGLETLSMKSGRNVFRYNCVLDTGSGMMVNRQGDYNVYYGNWIGETANGWRHSGDGNISAYNYVRVKTRGNGIRLHPGEYYDGSSSQAANRYIYKSANDGIHRRNVYSNVTRALEHFARAPTSAAVFVENPTGNVIDDLAIYSDSFVGTTVQTSYTNPGGEGYTASQFCANNTCGRNITITPTDLPQSTCGNPRLFSGPMGGAPITVPDTTNYHELIRGTTLKPPSWWE